MHAAPVLYVVITSSNARVLRQPIGYQHPLRASNERAAYRQ